LGAKKVLYQIMAPITLMTFILGGCIALALKTENRVREQELPSLRYSGLAEAYVDMKRSMLDYQATISGLQNTNALLDQAVTARAPETKVLTDQVNEARFIAGLTEVKGPGIIVTLADSKHAPTEPDQPSLVPMVVSPYLIHDADIERVLNELKAGGAEAFAVNGERIIVNSAVRCVGPAIQINGVPQTSPYKIVAIGDPAGLTKTLDMSGGVADGFKETDPAMISIQQSDGLTIPAYDGATLFRYAKPVYSSASAGG
jgi:uncharacterized protein YlxW (UPF0749 family)